MKNLIKNKSFVIGFVSGIFLIILANIYFGIVRYAYPLIENRLSIGFPFPVYERWANSQTDFYWIGIIANVLIAIIFSILTGWLFKFVLFKNQYSQTTFYNKAFKTGFWTNIFLFFVLNYLSYVSASYEYANRKIKFAHDGYGWGFPFEMYRNFLGYPFNDIGFTFEGVIINIFVTVICGFILGSTFRFIWSKFTTQKLR